MITAALAFAIALAVPSETEPTPSIAHVTQSSFFDQTPERRVIKEAMGKALSKRDWNAVYDIAVKAVAELPKIDGGQDAYSTYTQEILVLAGRTQELLKAAKPHLGPYGPVKGELLHNLTEYAKFQEKHRSDPEAIQLLNSGGGRWMTHRSSALQMSLQASLLMGRLNDAVRFQEEIDADIAAMPPICGTGMEFAILDQRTQTIPLRMLGKRDIGGLQALSDGLYEPDRELKIESDEQKRIMAVFSSILLGHLARTEGDRKEAKAYYMKAKALMEQRRVIVNRERLQWMLVRELLAKL